jgi:25S rRNA (uracil2634-N3)-methyltransferase
MPDLDNSKGLKRPRATLLHGTDDTTGRPPIRDTSCLFAATETVKCAWGNGCVSCAYKVGTFDVALDSDFCKRIPNQRPELCPRARLNRRIPDIPPLGYKTGMSALTVGDGDFSFSLALARFGCDVVATSYEPKDTVFDVYNSLAVTDNAAELERRGAALVYSVDGTNLERTLPESLVKRKYHRIVWNFPCSAIAKGQDGQNREMEFNKKLVNNFINSCWQLLFPQGRIVITHKTKPPFNQWKIDEVAVLDVPKVHYLHRVVFDRCLFPPYVPRKALDSKSFPCHDACMYIFEVSDGSAQSSAAKTSEEIEGIPTVEFCNTASLQDAAPSSMIGVTSTLLLALRNKLLHKASDTIVSKHAKRKRM